MLPLIADYEHMIGKRVTKKSRATPKPFKSGRKVNTVKDVINHPILNVPAYTFEEDDSYVACKHCVWFIGGETK